MKTYTQTEIDALIEHLETAYRSLCRVDLFNDARGIANAITLIQSLRQPVKEEPWVELAEKIRKERNRLRAQVINFIAWYERSGPGDRIEAVIRDANAALTAIQADVYPDRPLQLPAPPAAPADKWAEEDEKTYCRFLKQHGFNDCSNIRNFFMDTLQHARTAAEGGSR